MARKKKAVKKKAAKKKAVKKKVVKKKVAKKKAAKKTTNKKATKKRATKKTGKKLNLSALISEPAVRVGRKVRDFRLPATGEKTFHLAAFKGKKVVLYFYPKDSTPGCTLQGQEFTQFHSSFTKVNTVVFGISRDTIRSHENFKAKQNYSIDLISDTDEELCDLFGVIKMKNMYGRQVRGIERSTFIIDEDGVLVKEWRKVKAQGHAEEVLDFIKEN